MNRLKQILGTFGDTRWNLPACVAIAGLSGSLAAVLPGIEPYWHAHGLTDNDIWTLQAAFAWTFAFAQIPTGYWADAMGRKRSLAFGSLLVIAGDLLYALGGSFTTFLIAEVLCGVAMACVAGADSALLYDTLASENRTEENRWWSGMMSATMFGVSAVASIIGGAFASVDAKLPFLVSAVAAALQLIVIATLREPPIASGERLVSLRQIGGVIRGLVADAPIRWIMLAWCTLVTATWVAVWFYPKYFRAAGLSVETQGWVFAFYHLVAGAAALTARRFKRSDNDIFLVFVTFALCAASAHLLFGVTMVWWGFLFGALHQLNRGAVPVIFSSALNDRTPSHIRATVLSIQGAFITAVYGTVSFRLGWAADVLGYQGALVLLSAAVVVASLLVWRVRPAL